MTPTQLAQLGQVNTAVNAIPYDALSARSEGYDVWKDTPDGGTWVCRDYVLAKADRLKALGWPASSLTVVLCWVEPAAGSEYHAVLAVEDAGETWILDSRIAEPYLLAAPLAPADQYRWDRRQVAGSVDFVPMVA